MDESMDENKQIEKAKDRRIWLISTGESGVRWQDCIDKDIICGGWKEIVEKYGEKLFKFKNFKECKKKMNKISKPNDKWPAYICKFLYDVSVGDIVLALKGMNKILGIGVIKSEPDIDKSDEEYPLYREVLWFKTDLNLESPKNLESTIAELKKEEIEKNPQLKRIIDPIIKILNVFGKITQISQILESKGQVILYGPPGTGKTWLAENYAKAKTDRKFYEFVTFHPSYSYEEFVEGIRPKIDDEGKIYYEVEDGIFKQICKIAYNELLDKAKIDRSKRWKTEVPELTDDEKEQIQNVLKEENYLKFYLIIDEINRGDISRIFGELITLLEADKRLFAENELIVTLPYSKTKFGIPPNLYIIGTMNTADRSIALIDVALRRRFGFIELMPDYEILEKELLNDEDEAKDVKELAINALRALNEKIRKLYDRDHQIGHSYFLKLKDCKLKDSKSKDKDDLRDDTIEMLKQIWFYEVIPLLQEYFYDTPKKLEEILGDFVKVDGNSYEFKNPDELPNSDFIELLKKLTGEKGG